MATRSSASEVPQDEAPDVSEAPKASDEAADEAPHEQVQARLLALVAPDGTEYLSNSPAEISVLHYGRGYTFRDHATWQDALAWLGDHAAVPVDTRTTS